MSNDTNTFSLRRFNDMDWNGWAGAMEFCDGSDPFIAEVKVGGNDAVIILDGNPGDKEEWTLEICCSVNVFSADGFQPIATWTQEFKPRKGCNVPTAIAEAKEFYECVLRPVDGIIPPRRLVYLGFVHCEMSTPTEPNVE